MTTSNKETPGLSPCPFCGSANVYVTESAVCCDSCGGKVSNYFGKSDAFKAWNRRPVHQDAGEQGGEPIRVGPYWVTCGKCGDEYETSSIHVCQSIVESPSAETLTPQSQTREEAGLLLCPFCNSRAELLTTLSGTHRWFVQCYYGNPACHCQTQLYTTHVEATQAWNNRAANESSQASGVSGEEEQAAFDRWFLEQADFFTSPEIRRGPANDKWIKFRAELDKRLAATFSAPSPPATAETEEIAREIARRIHEVVPEFKIRSDVNIVFEVNDVLARHSASQCDQCDELAALREDKERLEQEIKDAASECDEVARSPVVDKAERRTWKSMAARLRAALTKQAKL